MNKSLRFLIAFSLLAIIYGCVKEDNAPNGQKDLHEVVFHAGWAPETKTELQSDGSVWWSPGDKIALYIEGDTTKYCLTSNCTELSPTTDFIGMIGENDGNKRFYAIYPYDKARCFNGFTIPSVQYAKAGAFSPGQFISFASSNDKNLYFYNVCAGIKFSVAHEGISKVVFKNREDYYPITGNMRPRFWNNFPDQDDMISPEYSGVSNTLTVYPDTGKYFIPGEYYFAALHQGTASFVISYYADDKVATTGLYTRSLYRSTIVALLEKDKNLSFEDNNDYTYSILGSNILPDGVDKTTIQDVVFHVSSDVTTETVVPSSIPRFVRMGYYDMEYIPVYFELIGTTAHYYTKADRYMMTGVYGIQFTDWRELRSVDLSMFCTDQVCHFDDMFRGCVNLESVDLSGFNTSNTLSFRAMFQGCYKLKNLDISNFSSKSVDMAYNPYSCMFNKCFNLVSLNLGNFEINEGADHTMFAFARNSHNCAIRCTSGTREALCNPSSKLGTNEQYITWVLPDEEMPSLEPYQFDYYSTDFSKDKTVKLLQRASVGNGINIVLMGDGYSDRMIDDGSYDEDMSKAMNAIFKDEPYATFRNYFNVYVVYAVSENEICGESNTAFQALIGGMDPVNGGVAYFDDFFFDKYAKIPYNDISETCIILILNQEPGYVAGVAHNGVIMEGDDVSDVTDYAKGGSVAMICRQLEDEYYSYVVAHEFGHGFAKLADEYCVYGGAWPDGEKESYLEYSQKYGWWSNLDFTDNPATIKWSRFLNDERYTGTDIGVFEGATYSIGCWRPSQYSIMRQDVASGFNAPSREAIYKRIHRLAFGKDWQYDYEAFVEYDQKNIEADKAMQSVTMVKSSAMPDYLKRSFRKIERTITPDGKQKITVIMN